VVAVIIHWGSWPRFTCCPRRKARKIFKPFTCRILCQMSVIFYRMLCHTYTYTYLFNI